MRFRPLCVDYHARAQEIIATDRDIHARRMAALLLPNPSSLPRDGHPPPSCSQNSTSNDGDGIGLDDGRCDSYINNEEKRDENSSRVNTNTDDDSDDNVGRPIPGENNLSTRRVSVGPPPDFSDLLH